MNEFPSIDQLIQLAEKNPQALEEIREKHVNDLINKAPKHMQRRLKGLQFQIDCQRQLHQDSPMGSCVAITKMMMDSLYSLNQALHATDKDEHPVSHADPSSSSVLQFPAALS